MSTINDLPDETITHILSFLPIKQATQTSVLAKRWRILFAFSANLAVLEHEEDNLETFMDFVDRVLEVSGNSPIKKFTLKCQNGFDKARINRWIHNVLNRGVLDLDLDLSLTKTDEYSLPVEVFTCKTIVKLNLTGIDLVKLPEDPSWPAIQWFFDTMSCDIIMGTDSEELDQLFHDLSELH